MVLSSDTKLLLSGEEVSSRINHQEFRLWTSRVYLVIDTVFDFRIQAHAGVSLNQIKSVLLD